MPELIDLTENNPHPDVLTVTSFGNPLIDDLVATGDWRNKDAMAQQLGDWSEWLETVEPQTAEAKELAAKTFEATMILHTHLEELNQPLH